MPKKTAAKSKPLYRGKLPAHKECPDTQEHGRAALPRRPEQTVKDRAAQQHARVIRPTTPDADFTHAKPVPISHFTLREDGSIQIEQGRAGDTRVLPRRPEQTVEDGAAQQHGPTTNPASSSQRKPSDDHSPSPGGSNERSECRVVCSSDVGRGEGGLSVPQLIFSHDSPFVRLYHADCLSLLDAIAAKYPQGRFDAIFADPPYFLSNGGITCHAGRMVRVDKGDWDKSRGPELNHEFNREWLRRCQRVLKPNGTIWVSGTHHVIFSIGYALQQLGYKILNDIAWEKPNPPPNLSCRYFTHSTETILWAARDEKSKHVFNYQDMRKVTGKQMKTVWRHGEFETRINTNTHELKSSSGTEKEIGENSCELVSNVWTMSAPGNDEKTHGKHPTQKPIALIERCLLASTNEGDLVLDPFLGGGTTAIACLRLKRGCVGIELDEAHARLAIIRADKEIISIWLRHFRVTIEISVVGTLRCGVRSATAANIGRACQSPDRRPSENPEGIPSFSPVVATRSGATLGKCPKNPPNPEGVVSNRRPNSSFKTQNSTLQKDLDLFPDSINGSRVTDKPQVPTERIFHECKFVFLSCAEVERGAVVHTTVDVSLQEAWAKTPNGKKRETTHIVRCETEIFRVKYPPP